MKNSQVRPCLVCYFRSFEEATACDEKSFFLGQLSALKMIGFKCEKLVPFMYLLIFVFLEKFVTTL